MKNTFSKLLISTALLGLIPLPLSTLAQPSPAQQAGQRAPRGERAERRERHPEIRAALRALENAKRHLQEGAHDFAGHRAKALELTEQAIRECHEALQFDKK